MPIIHAFDADGGFLAGDTATGLTAYSYPTSPYATRAKRDPAKVAAQLLARETQRVSDYSPQYDVHIMAQLVALTTPNRSN